MPRIIGYSYREWGRVPAAPPAIAAVDPPDAALVHLRHPSWVTPRDVGRIVSHLPSLAATLSIVGLWSTNPWYWPIVGIAPLAIYLWWLTTRFTKETVRTFDAMEGLPPARLLSGGGR